MPLLCGPHIQTNTSINSSPYKGGPLDGLPVITDTHLACLQCFRIDSRLVLLYKVTYDLVAIPASDYLIRNTRLSSIIHPLAYRQITTLKDYYKYTFFPRKIIHWNALPHHIPILPTLAQFSTAVCQLVHSVP